MLTLTLALTFTLTLILALTLSLTLILAALTLPRPLTPIPHHQVRVVPVAHPLLTTDLHRRITPWRHLRHTPGQE